LVLEAERLGFHSAWTAEAYGSDTVTPAAWIAARTERIRIGTAIMQMPARTPAMTAMTATTLDQLSGGRFLLGLGVSGPQVVEGWHGVPFGKPLVRTREYAAIVRAIWAREKPLEFKGEYYQIPHAGPGATGLGKPLKSILHGRADIPIYLAAIGPKNVALAGEIFDEDLFAYREDVDLSWRLRHRGWGIVGAPEVLACNPWLHDAVVDLFMDSEVATGHAGGR
jgi:F420-dependent oxidoreductase-like protein